MTVDNDAPAEDWRGLFLQVRKLLQRAESLFDRERMRRDYWREQVKGLEQQKAELLEALVSADAHCHDLNRDGRCYYCEVLAKHRERI